MSDVEKKVRIVYEADTGSAESGIDNLQKKNEKFVNKVEKSEKGAFAAQKNAVREANKAHGENSRRSKLEERATRTKAAEARRVRKEENAHAKDQNKALRERIDLLRGTTKAQRASLEAEKKADQRRAAFASRYQQILNRYDGGRGVGGGRGGPPGSRQEGSEGGGGLLGGFARRLAPAALATMAIGAVVGYVKSELGEGYGAAQQFNRARAGLAGMDLGDLESESSKRAAQRAGFNSIDTMNQAALIARQTGSVGSTNLAQRLSRSGAGLGVEEIGSFMGNLTRSGNRMDGRGNQVLFQTMRNAVSSGLDKSRTGEFMESMASVIQDVGNRSTGTVDASGISALLGAFGKLGGSAFQGARGLNVLSTLDQNIRGLGQFGRNDAAQAMALQSSGYGMPGSGRSLVDSLRIFQRGIFENPEQGIETIGNFLKYTERNTAGGDEERVALSQSIMQGLNFDQIDKLTGLFRSGNMEDLKKELEKLKRENEPLQSIDEILRGGILTSLQHDAELTDRSVVIGQKIEESVRDLQNMWHQFSDGGLQTIISALNTIARGIISMGHHFGFAVGDPTTAREDLDKVENLISSGTSSARSEAMTQLKDMKSNLRSYLHGASESETRGVIERIHELEDRLNSSMPGIVGATSRGLPIGGPVNTGGLAAINATPASPQSNTTVIEVRDARSGDPAEARMDTLSIASRNAL